MAAAININNINVRYNQIHNVRNELEDPDEWSKSESFYREGDSLTPYGCPNTGLSTDIVYNGTFMGISFTDFVTGDHPSFKVTFSDEEPEQPEPQLELTVDSLNADIRMSIESDLPLTQTPTTTCLFSTRPVSSDILPTWKTPIISANEPEAARSAEFSIE